MAVKMVDRMAVLMAVLTAVTMADPKVGQTADLMVLATFYVKVLKLAGLKVWMMVHQMATMTICLWAVTMAFLTDLMMAKKIIGLMMVLMDDR